MCMALTSCCTTWGGLEDFSAEVQNQREDATNASFCPDEMMVSSYSIEMSNDWSDRVMVG